MMDFFSEYDDTKEMLTNLQKETMFEIIEEFPDVRYYDETKLMQSLKDVFAKYQTSFIFIIDKWDCVLRDKKNDSIAQETYLKFLSALFKNQSYLALVYMTGILPIKKYGGHSAINMFTEIAMTNARELSEFTGFTEKEVKKLCEEYNMLFAETKRWYDGYNLKVTSIYDPRLVVMSMTGHDYNNELEFHVIGSLKFTEKIC